MLSPQSVLIVDRSDDNREVLATALERRGMRILSASRAKEGLELARRHHPDLIVLDLDTVTNPPDTNCGPFEAESKCRATPLVVIGSVRRETSFGRHGEIVAKPYHYGPLIRRIEELLLGAGPPPATRADNGLS